MMPTGEPVQPVDIAPGIRPAEAARVALLRAAIADGTYIVDAETTAAAIIAGDELTSPDAP